MSTYYMRLSAVTILLACGLLDSSCYGQTNENGRPRGENVHVLSNDGDGTLVVKTPDFYSVPDTANHVGIVAPGTRVQVLESRTDKSLPILKWSRVRILDGNRKGSEGWVSSRCVSEVVPSAGNGGSGRVARRGDRESSSLQVVVATRLLAAPDNPGDAIGELDPGTGLQHVNDTPTPSALFKTVQWYQVKVTTGPLKGKTGYVLAHHCKGEQSRRLPYNSAKAIGYAEQYCKKGNNCSTGEYGSIAFPATFANNLTSTDCAHFQGHILLAAGVNISGYEATCASKVPIRVLDLFEWFNAAASKYANVSRFDEWSRARRGDYCFYFPPGRSRHMMMLANKPKKRGGKIFGHSRNRCGDEFVAFEADKCVFFRIEDFQAVSPSPD